MFLTQACCAMLSGRQESVGKADRPAEKRNSQKENYLKRSISWRGGQSRAARWGHARCTQMSPPATACDLAPPATACDLTLLATSRRSVGICQGRHANAILQFASLVQWRQVLRIHLVTHPRHLYTSLSAQLLSSCLPFLSIFSACRSRPLRLVVDVYFFYHRF